VPIDYEGRLAKLELSEAERPKIDPDFEEVTEGEQVERKQSPGSHDTGGQTERHSLMKWNARRTWARPLRTPRGGVWITVLKVLYRSEAFSSSFRHVSTNRRYPARIQR
jgi:hypothetical protein